MTTNKKNFKYCIVPECKNTSTNAPKKMFISLPSDINLRKAWQRAMRRFDYVSDKGTKFCCEDHFDVKEDIENYLYVKTMKGGKIKLKPGVIPHIFDCQNKSSLLQTDEVRLLIEKEKQKAVIEKLLHEHEEVNFEAIKVEECRSVDQGIQVNVKPRRRSKAVQCLGRNFVKITYRKRKSGEIANETNKRVEQTCPVIV